MKFIANSPAIELMFPRFILSTNLLIWYSHIILNARYKWYAVMLNRIALAESYWFEGGLTLQGWALPLFVRLPSLFQFCTKYIMSC